MKKIRLKWTVKELQSFTQIFGRIVTIDVEQLRDDPNLYLGAYILLELQTRLVTSWQRAKLLGRQEVRVSITTTEALAVFSLVSEGHFQWIVKIDTYEETIMQQLYGIIHKTYYT